MGMLHLHSTWWARSCAPRVWHRRGDWVGGGWWVLDGGWVFVCVTIFDGVCVWQVRHHA